MKIVYMDLDGVIIDWDTASMELFGFRGVQADRWDHLVELVAERDGIDKDRAMGRVWAAIDREGPEWWANMDVYDAGLALYEACWQVAPVVFVTSPSRSPSSAAGKVMWITKHAKTFTRLRGKARHSFGEFGMKPARRAYAISPAKAMLAGPTKLLIDDRKLNCDRFVAAGGEALLWPQPWNSAGHGIDADELVYHQQDAIDWACAWAREH